MFCLFFFFLGNNLGIYLWLYCALTTYLVLYRSLRFWVKRWLMYVIEFCYFGNYVLMAFVLIFGTNRHVFSIAYVCATGVMSLAVIAFNNQAQFNSTDHLTSSFIHTLPLITSWALRWKHLLYNIASFKGYGLNIMDFSDLTYENDTQFSSLVYLPIVFWCCWAGCYLACTSTIFNKFVMETDKYGSGIGDFVTAQPLKFLWGDHSKRRHFKYTLQHFIFFTLAMPLTWLFFYSFTLNTIYIIFIILYLGWNTGRIDMKHMARRIIKVEKEVEKVVTGEIIPEANKEKNKDEKSTKNFY